MKKLLRRCAPWAFASLAAVLVMPQTAYAHPGVGVGVAVGTGNISPGLTVTPTPQPSVTFTGTVTGVFDVLSLTVPDPTHVVVGPMNCTFNGSDSIGSVLAGQGAGNLTCSGTTTHVTDTVGAGTATASCAVNFTRVGPVVVVNAQCSLTFTSTNPARPAISIGNATVAAGCLFEPTTAPGAPVTGYTLQCAVAAGGIA